jgi:hypothetical protein
MATVALACNKCTGVADTKAEKSVVKLMSVVRMMANTEKQMASVTILQVWRCRVKKGEGKECFVEAQKRRSVVP